MALHPNITISEDWHRTTLNNFSTYNAVTTSSVLGQVPAGSYTFGISTQNHVNLRTFNEPQGWTGPITTGYLASYNHQPGGTITLPSGTTTLTSKYISPIDITVTGTSAVLGLALPSFPSASINMSSSYLVLSSDGFNQAVCSLSFASATPITTSGNTALLWSFSQITGLNAAAITGVRLILNATSGCTVTVMALRMMDANWVLTDTTFDNLNGVLRRAIPINGNSTSIVPANQTLPILWRSANPSSVDDPHPIDSTFGFYFNTGSQTGANSFNFNVAENASSQTWVNFKVQWGTTSSVSITGVDGTNHQTSATFSNNTTYWVQCQYSGSGNSAQLDVYSVDGTLTPVTNVADVTGSTSASAFPSRRGRIGFQATLIDGDTYVGAWRPESVLFAQYTSAGLSSMTPVKGARLYVNDSPDISYWSSWSPYTNGTVAPLVSPDQNRTTTGQSTKVVTLADSATGALQQGLISNILSPVGDTVSGITDFSRLSISFDLWIPGAVNGAYLGTLGAKLVSPTGTVIPMAVPLTSFNQWQNVQLSVPYSALPRPSGLFQFVIYAQAQAGYTFWVDNTKITQPSIDWRARSNNTAPWVRFGDLINSDTDGVSFFPYQGTQLEIQALALRQDSFILDKITVVPAYAELGSLLPAVLDIPTNISPPTIT